jgi:hypothetical protein
MSFEESFIRENLKSKLIYKNSGGDFLVQQELVVCDGNCRADMALLTPEELHGYEIKSDRDSLNCLDRQVESYGRFFDRVTVVAGRHWGDVSERVPKWCGVLMATQNANGEFAWIQVRPGGTSPHVEHHLAAQLMWKSYLVERLTALHGRMPPTAWSRAMLAEHLAEVCGPRGVRQELMAFLRWKRTAPPLSLTLQDIH